MTMTRKPMKPNPQKIACSAIAAFAAIQALDPRPSYGSRPAPTAGERNPYAKLTDRDAARLRKLYAAVRELGCTHKATCLGLAGCFSLHSRTVAKIVYGERRAGKIVSKKGY